MIKLDAEQQRAVDIDDKRIVVIAAAGSGKSRTLLARIQRLMNDGVRANEILALTFTNAAALEMRSRYKDMQKNCEIPMFCTFHAFCYSLIAKDPIVRADIGYRDVPAVATSSELDRIWKSVKLILSIKLSDNVLNKKEHEVGAKDRFQYNAFWKMYYKKLHEENLITFDIMCYEICDLFKKDHPYIRKYKAQYKYIFIDEFQDTDERQWDFAKSFTDSSIFVVGDAKQAIYGFRGADSSIIKSLTEDRGWTTVKLFRNYRSTSQICDYSNSIHKTHISGGKDVSYYLDMVSDRSGGEVKVNGGFLHQVITNERGYRDQIELTNNIIQENVFSILDDVPASETIALLCRSNSEVSEVCDVLKHYNISFTTKAKTSTVEKYLRAATDNNYLVDWLSNELSSDKYNDYLRMCLINDSYKTADGFMNLFIDRFQKQFEIIHQIQNILNSEADPIIKYITIGGIFKLKIDPNITINDDDEVISSLLSLTGTGNDAKIYVGTIHSVKGLEFDTVHLIDVNSLSWKNMWDDEEQLNVFYVGCTRAKNKLVVWKSTALVYEIVSI